MFFHELPTHDLIHHFRIFFNHVWNSSLTILYTHDAFASSGCQNNVCCFILIILFATKISCGLTWEPSTSISFLNSSRCKILAINMTCGTFSMRAHKNSLWPSPITMSFVDMWKSFIILIGQFSKILFQDNPITENSI